MRTDKARIKSVETLAFIMPVYDLTSTTEMVPTRTDAVCIEVWAWNHRKQRFEMNATYGASERRRASAHAASLHERLKRELGILAD
jgi:hypothetical protein